MFLAQHVALGQKHGQSSGGHIVSCAFDFSEDIHIHLLMNGGISDLHLDLFTILFLCFSPEIFFPRIPAAAFGGFKG